MQYITTASYSGLMENNSYGGTSSFFLYDSVEAETLSWYFKSDKTASHAVPVYGFPGPLFYVIHIVGLFSLGISIVVSALVLLNLLRPKQPPLWSRPIGERLVIYLAICDLFFSFSHMLDHAYMLAALDHPPDIPCGIFAFMLLEFVLAQAIVVTFTAFNAFMMVVKEKKLRLGQYDWKLLFIALGLPFCLLLVPAGFGYLGPSGPWCVIDMRRPYGTLLANVIAVSIVLTFLINLGSYLLVWLKIKQVAPKMQGASGQAASNSRKYHRSARIMMLFVAVYMAQWWAYVVYAGWTVFGDPHYVVTVAAVFFSNMGGLFNCVVYSMVRKKYTSVGDRQETTVSYVAR